MKQAQVIYYLFREAAMEHPHSIDVGYYECNGLLLKDVKRRLISIRGRQMPDLFSWSYKRNYKNDFMWHDVSDNDVILPTNDAEYILKGSELIDRDGCLEQCTSESDSEGDIQCKTMLKDNSSKLKKLEENSRELVKVYKQRLVPERNGSDATTQTEDVSTSVSKQYPSSCRGDKPLPDKKKLSPAARGETLPILEVVETSCGSPMNARKVPVLNFKHIFPCRDVGVDERKLIGTIQHEHRAAHSEKREQDLSVLSSCSVSWKKLGDKLAPLKFASTNSITTARSGDLYKQESTAPAKLPQKSSLTRYRPRHSFSNSEYFDGYDIYLSRLKDAEVIRHSNARSSTESWQTYYDYDKETSSKYGESPVDSVSNRTISKLVEANEPEKDKSLWWEEVPTPKQVNEDPRKSRKNKLDWEKNLQEAVNMIINPGQEHKQ